MDDGVRFGTFELRARERQLLIDGAAVALGGRAFDLLTALVERRDRVVPRAELVELVWPRRIVEENNLAVQVLALRRVLGEHAIATVPGRGYRFVLPVQGDAPAERPAPPAPHRGHLLPTPVAMHGRGDDLQTLAWLLDTQRLVTVVGAGGIGKSTLAAAAARARAEAMRDGIAWIELAPQGDAAAVPAVVGQALGIETGRGGEAAPALATALRSREVLVVLDGAEHLVDAVASTAQHLLAGAPGLRLLVTSQTPLKVAGERVLRLGTLAVPSGPTGAREALGHGAVALFVDQVQAADPRFVFDDGNAGVVIDLCRRLDGLPLAIKLAAARTPLLGLHDLLAHVDHSLRLLGGGARDAPTRQQTLRATLDWSHGLLAPAERTVFRRLGVFAGGFSLEAAQAVACDAEIDRWTVVEHLATLVDRSLVEADHADAPRYRLLATAREYALAQLDSVGETSALRQRHAQVYAAYVDAAERAAWTTSDKGWLGRHAPELDNLRAALAWSIPREPVLATTLIGAAGELFHAHTLRHDVRAWCEALESAGGPVPDGPAAARYWLIRAWNLAALDHRRLQLFADRAERLYRVLGDAKGLYVTLCVRSVGIAPPLAEPPRGRLDEALALEQGGWPPRLRAWGFIARTVVCNFEGDYASALAAADAGVRIATAAGAGWNAEFLRGWRAAAHLGLSRIDEALRDTSAMVQLTRRGPTGYDALSYGLHAQALLMAHRTDEARLVLGEQFDMLRTAAWDSMNYFCDTYVLLALRERRLEDTLRLIGYADEVCPPIGLQWPRSVAFRERIVASAGREVGPDARDTLLAEGRALDAETVCAVTLRSTALDRDR